MKFTELDRFTRGYVECALWTEEESLDGKGFADLAPDTLNKMIAECAAFQRASATALDAATAHYSLEHAGHDFWLTRNGHGAGFWDGDLPDELGNLLTDAAKKAGEVWIYLGDDGCIYQT